MTGADAPVTPIQAGGVREELIDGELLLYLPNAKRAIYLNATAAVIWALCDGQRNSGEIVSMLAESYPEAQATMAAQVHEALNHLSGLGVVTLKR